MTPETAAKIYRAMPPDQQAEAKRLIGLGRDRVNVVKTLHGADMARMGVEAEDEATIEPTTGERAASAAMGAAEQVSPSPGALMASGLAGNVAGPVIGGSLMALRHAFGTDEAASEAKAQDPVGFRAGEMAGMVPDAIAGVAGAAKAIPAMVKAAPGAGRNIMSALKARLAGSKDIAKGAAEGFAKGAEQGGITGAAVGAGKGALGKAFPKPIELTADMVKKAPPSNPYANAGVEWKPASGSSSATSPQAMLKSLDDVAPSPAPPPVGEAPDVKAVRIEEIAEKLKKELTPMPGPTPALTGTRASRADAAAMEGTVSGGKAPKASDDLRALMPKPMASEGAREKMIRHMLSTEKKADPVASRILSPADEGAHVPMSTLDINDMASAADRAQRATRSKAGVWDRNDWRADLVAGKSIANPTPQKLSPPNPPPMDVSTRGAPAAPSPTTAPGAMPSPQEMAQMMRAKVGDKKAYAELVQMAQGADENYMQAVWAALNALGK